MVHPRLFADRPQGVFQVRVIVSVLLAMLLAACSPQYAVKPAAIDRYHAAIVDVTSDVPDSEEQAQQLATLLLDALDKRHVYQSLVRDPQETRGATLLVQVNIVDIHRTTASRLIGLGSIERSNEVTVEISLLDQATREPLASFRLKGVSPKRHGLAGDWPWGSVDEALQQISEKLARQLDDWSK